MAACRASTSTRARTISGHQANGGILLNSRCQRAASIRGACYPIRRSRDDVHVVVLPRVGHVRQISVRAIEINVVVVISVEESADLECAAEADRMTAGI